MARKAKPAIEMISPDPSAPNASVVAKLRRRPDTLFERRVHAVCKAIPRGKVTTYGAIAKVLHVGSARAVGQALRRNPYAPTVPCHRVISFNFDLGGFSGSWTEFACRKTDLLKSEGVPFDDRRLKDRSHCLTADDLQKVIEDEGVHIPTEAEDEGVQIPAETKGEGMHVPTEAS